ncbi:MAG TPA: AAA family ATPase, partial [Anaerolineae bacterium]|nr:AAA family ATPase [Anaerolineae bacterium]
MDRIAVIGVTGSGKTTFARNLAQHIDGVHIELDALHWEANWIEAPDEIFRERVEQATQTERWTTDGNYSKVRDIVWGRADTIVW